MNISKSIILNAILIIAIILLGWQNIKQYKMIDKQTIQLSNKNTDDNKHTSIMYEQELETLKKTNKELYDSLKVYKDEIDYLLQFKYKKEYVVKDTIINVDTTEINDIHEFVYTNPIPNDTLNYKLTIGSKIEPNWYNIKFNITEQFTIVNKQINDINETTIAPSTSSGQITEVTALKQKEKTKLLDNFAFGPSITMGYGLMNKQIDIVVGVSAIWKIK